MYRFALRYQSKIISKYSIQFNAFLIDSLKQYFKTEIKIIKGEKYDIIKCPNIRDNLKTFEFYIIKQVYDVLTLSFNPNKNNMSEDLIPYGKQESIIDVFDRLTGNLPVKTGLEYTEAIIIDNGTIDQSQYIAQRNDMPTPPAILSVLSSKKEAESFANFVIDLVKDNELYALNVWKQILCFEHAMKYIKDNIQENAITEAEKAMDKNISISSRNTFDFKICGDDYLIELYNLQAQVKEQIKERESLHKAHKGKEWVYTDIDTGETKVFIPPILEKSTPVLTIKGL